MDKICNTCMYHCNGREDFWKAQSLDELKKSPCWGCKFIFDDDNYNEILKRCPFCGGEAHFLHDDGGDSGDETYSVECDNCSCDIGWYNTRKEAVEAWNRRVR